MKIALEDRDTATEYDVQSGDTLESIVLDQCPEIGDWTVLAMFNWGTLEPKEVLRALIETIGVKTGALSDIGFVSRPQTIELEPDTDLPHKLLIPAIWEKEGCALERAHTINVRPLPKPASAIDISTLDPWFIPALEECEIEYDLEGVEKCADTVQLDVFGSNYCECTDLNDGLGTYGNPDDHIDTPIFTKDLAAQAKERQSYGMPDGEEWKGESAATAGILSRTTGSADTRYINVAFSPYTVHMRYRKQSEDGDNAARIILKPFWPQWTEATTELTGAAVTTVVEANQVRVQWTNTSKCDRGILKITDVKGQQVHMAALPGAKLAAGAQEMIWDKQYRPDAENSRFDRTYLDDSADAPNNLNAPYTYKIIVFVRAKTMASLKIEWEIKDTGRLKNGQLRITDKNGRLVFHKALSAAKVASGEQSYQWDGSYGEDAGNSEDGSEIIPADMPYRVQIHAHTEVGEDNGLALAATHTEVRLYVDPETVTPRDLAYDPYMRAKQSMLVSLGPLVPGDPPAQGDGTRWYRYKLARYGFHPGPVTDAVAANDDYHIALREFKRSVPKQGNVAAPNFTRLTVNTDEDADTAVAINTIRNSDKRRWFGSLTQVRANSNTPDMSDNDVATFINNPNADMIVWVDDRQYYTGGSAKDEYNQDFLSGSPVANRFALDNYRGGIKARDARTGLDADAIPRPWIPLQTKLRLLSKRQGLTDRQDVTAGALRDQILRHVIGPLRVDWTFDELRRDLSTIDHRPPGAAAAYDNDYVRARYYANWVIDQMKATYRRADTGRDAVCTNCRGGAAPNDLGGIRPDDGSLNTYYQKAFGYGDLNLDPWKATAVAATESIATVTHEHLVGAQTGPTSGLYGNLIGASGVYFKPSRIAGDGYRVRAEVQFDAFAGYDFPNLEVLKARYPVRPQAHTARLRIWRRSSIRGYACWANSTGHWPGLLTGFRNQYKAAHVYFVFENEPDKLFDISDIYNASVRAQRNRYKDIVRNNVSPLMDRLRRAGEMNLSRDHLWPWVHNGSVWPYESGEGVNVATAYDDLKTAATSAWRGFRASLLYSIVREVEKQGCLRGHLLVEFLSTPRFYLEEYRCDGGVDTHRHWYVRERGTATGGMNGTRCPSPFCNGTGRFRSRGRLAATGTIKSKTRISLPAVGVALGATWLFTTSDSETWVHEVGHHRHLEHAANGPGAQYASSGPQANANLHDNQDNTKIPDWGALGVVSTAEQDWDRRCIMSYNKDAPRYYCGKCILRNRGWKVRALTFPGTDKTET